MPEKVAQRTEDASGDVPAEAVKREQTSSEKQFRVYEDDWLSRFKRDIRILVYLSKLFYRWLVFGGRLRRAWRRADKTGQPFSLEEIVGTGK